MTIAAHIDLSNQGNESILHHCMQLLSANNPGDHFIYFISKKNKAILQKPNTTPVFISPTIRNSLLLHYWYNFKLPSLLSRYNADVFISETGICSLQTDVPQFIVLKDVDFLTKGTSKKNDHILYKRKFFPSHIKKVSAIGVSRECISEKLKLQYPTAENKIQTIYSGLNEDYQALSENEKELIKARYTGERDFFLFYLNPESKEFVLPVLRSFSQFKKWQQSNMQLIILWDKVDINIVLNKLNTYKYREDVKVISHSNDMESAKIAGSAYAVIYAGDGNDKREIVLNSLKCEVPVICITAHFLYEDAVIHTLPDEKAITESMMSVYKDESLRKKFIMQGKEYSKRYSWNNTAALLWNILQSKQ